MGVGVGSIRVAKETHDFSSMSGLRAAGRDHRNTAPLVPASWLQRSRRMPAIDRAEDETKTLCARCRQPRPVVGDCPYCQNLFLDGPRELRDRRGHRHGLVVCVWRRAPEEPEAELLGVTAA